MDEVTAKFSKVSSDLTNLLHKGEFDIHTANILLDDLNTLDYRRELFVSLQEASSLVTTICLTIRANHSFTAAKAMHLLNNLIAHQNLGSDKDILNRIFWWDLNIIKECSELIAVDVLQNILTILQCKEDIDAGLKETLLGRDGILINLLQSPLKINPKFNFKKDVYFNTTLIVVKCIQVLTKNVELFGDEDSSVLQRICDAITQLIYKGCDNECAEFNYIKITIYSLRTLCQVYLHSYHDLDVRLEEAMGIAKHLMGYGVQPVTEITKVAPSQQSSAELPLPVRRKPEAKKSKKRKPKITAIESLKKKTSINDQKLEIEPSRSYQTFRVEQPEVSQMLPRSESDASEAECGVGAGDARIAALSARVRQHALTLLLVLVKETDKQQMFGYWAALLPSSTREIGSRTLADIVTRDPSPHVRHAGLSVLLALLAGAKPYLHHAEYSEREAPFTPFSVSLGRICVSAHEIICRAITQATHAAAATLALRCACAALIALPYHRLQMGLLPPLIKAVRRFLIHKDTNLQVLALSVIGCLLSIDQTFSDVLICIMKETDTSKCTEKPSGNDDKPDVMEQNDGDMMNNDDLSDFEEYEDDIFVVKEMNKCDTIDCWVLELCLRNLGFVYRNKELVKCLPSTIPVMLESLQVLSALASFHFKTVLLDKVDMLAKMLGETFRSCHPQVDIRAIGLIAALGEAMLKAEQHEPNAVPQSTSSLFWKYLLDGPLPNLTQIQENIPALCDAFACIGERVYGELQRHHQILIVSLLLGWCMDAETHEKSVQDGGMFSNRRGAAVRGLAHLVVYKQLREDLCFVSDCGECAIRVLADSSLAARAKAAWTVAAITDALLMNERDGDVETVECEYLLRLLDSSVKGCKDNDKVKTNLIRAIGNLSKLLTEVHLTDSRTIPLLCSAVQALNAAAKSSNNMKVRWNACYALGNALSNDIIYNLKELTEESLSTLQNLMIDCKNIKVRIKAAVALRCIRNSNNGNKMAASDVVKGLSAVAKAMESALNVHHYLEYAHRDNLLEELCVTFTHLFCQLNAENVAEITDTVIFYVESIRETFRCVLARVPPEHIACKGSLDAAGHIRVKLVDNFSADTCQILTLMHDIFMWEA